MRPVGPNAVSDAGVAEYQPALKGIVEPVPAPNEGSRTVADDSPATPVTVTNESNENEVGGVRIGAHVPPPLSEWDAPAIVPLVTEWL